MHGEAMGKLRGMDQPEVDKDPSIQNPLVAIQPLLDLTDAPLLLKGLERLSQSLPLGMRAIKLECTDNLYQSFSGIRALISKPQEVPLIGK